MMNIEKQVKQKNYHAMIGVLLVNVVTFVLLVYPRVDFSPKTIPEWLINTLSVAQVVFIVMLGLAIVKEKRRSHSL